MSASEAGETSAKHIDPEAQPANQAGGQPAPHEENRPLGLRDLLASGSWYAIPAIWAWIAFVAIGVRLGHLLLLAGCSGFLLLVLVAVAYAAIWEQRHRAMPSAERKRAMGDQAKAIGQRLHGPVFSVIWSGFAAGCIAAVIVVIHVNNPFTKEAVDRVVDGNPWLFWGAVAAGAILGAGGRIWALAKPGRLAASDQLGDPGASKSKTQGQDSDRTTG